MVSSAILKAAAVATHLGNRAEYAIMGAVAPAKAARKAALAYCTLPVNRGRRKDNRVEEGEVAYVRGPRGSKLVTESWGEGPIVYLVHGWGGWRGQVAAFAGPISKLGYRVVAFDALSHGDSDAGRWGPEHSTGAELTESLKFVIADGGAPHAIVAHSLGCSAAAIATIEGAEPDRLALVSPNPDLVDAARATAAYLGLRRGVVGRMVGEVERMTDRDIADFDLLTMPSRAELPPTLMVHDRQDKEAPYEGTERLAAAWPTARLETTDGLGHHRILIDPATIERVAEFVAA